MTESIESSTKKTPNEQLGLKIVTLALEYDLVEESNRDEITRKLCNGGATAEDWRTWVENAVLREEAEEV